MKLDPSFTLYTKISLKCLKDLYIKPKTVKLLEENTVGESFIIEDLATISWYETKTQATKEKIDKLDFTN